MVYWPSLNTGSPLRQRGPVARTGRLPFPPMRAWLEQPHGRRHKASPQFCALTTSNAAAAAAAAASCFDYYFVETTLCIMHHHANHNHVNVQRPTHEITVSTLQDPQALVLFQQE